MPPRPSSYQCFGKKLTWPFGGVLPVLVPTAHLYGIISSAALHTPKRDLFVFRIVNDPFPKSAIDRFACSGTRGSARRVKASLLGKWRCQT